jgi:RNA polymerase sigma-70 factor (ECF subfamily)
MDAYTGLRGFEGRSSFKTWIIRIMLHNCYKKRLKLSYKNEVANEINEKSIPMFSNQEHSDINKAMAFRELNTVIEEALARIPLDYRMVFSLREINGLNVSETAHVLNISEDNVKVRQNRARAMLRKEIEKTYTPEDIFAFNLIYCDRMVERVMEKIEKLRSY